MDFSWDLFIDLGVLSAGLLIATGLRYRYRFFQRYLIPNALTAGFLLLPVYNFLMPVLGLNADNLGRMVYHLLSLSFISMTLRRSEETKTDGGEKKGRIIATSLATLFPWGIQAILGLVFTVFLMRTWMPDLFPAFGMLLPLGFVQGPGQAFAIGEGWVRFGFEGAGSIGLTFAATGFLFSSFGGVFLINLGIRRRWLDEQFIAQIDTSAVKSGIFPSRKRRPVGAEMTTESEAIDSFSLHIGLVLAVYLLAYLLLLGITSALALVGPLGADLAVNLWGISFIFSALTAIVVRGFMKRTGLDFVVDNRTLTRISGLSVDLMVVAAIAAISLVVVRAYLIPILVLSVVAGAVMLVVIPWFCSRMFVDHRFHRTLLIFGVSTGTLPTGLALLRAIDPEFETPVARDYMFASGLTFVFAIPFILAINLPAYAATTGNMLFLWAAVGVGAAYLIVVLAAFVLIARRRAFSWRSRVWMPPWVRNPRVPSDPLKQE
jgi:glutamate:Na+ symporter, ESS family